MKYCEQDTVRKGYSVAIQRALIHEYPSTGTPDMHMCSSCLHPNLVRGIPPSNPYGLTSFLFRSIHIQHHYYFRGCALLYTTLPWIQPAISLYIAYKIAHAIYNRHTCTGYSPRAAIQSFLMVPHTHQWPL